MSERQNQNGEHYGRSKSVYTLREQIYFLCGFKLFYLHKDFIYLVDAYEQCSL
jgi:hypothetical protein